MKPHHVHLAHKMTSKGWSTDELNYARKKMSMAEKSVAHTFLDGVIIWFIFLSFFIVNIVSMIFIAPFLLVFPNFYIYILLLVLGFSFGFLFLHIIRDVEHLLGSHHHIFLYILLPYFSLVLGFLVFTYADNNFLNYYFNVREPALFALVYVLSFIIPTLLRKRV